MDGFISGIINISYQIGYMFLDTTWQQQIIKAINKANFSGKDKDWEVVGTYVGSVAANILEF